MAYHADIGPVTCSMFGVVRFSSFGPVPAMRATSLDTLMIRTRDLEGLTAAVDSRSGRRHSTRKKGARWLVCHWVSKPSIVSLKGSAMICIAVHVLVVARSGIESLMETWWNNATYTSIVDKNVQARLLFYEQVCGIFDTLKALQVRFQ